MVQVVLPSPSGVGVMAVTSTYLPRGRPEIRLSTSRCTFALLAPYGINSSRCSPMRCATSSIGSSLAARAMSMSAGIDVTVISLA
jgi:hypothetical protein